MKKQITKLTSALLTFACVLCCICVGFTTWAQISSNNAVAQAEDTYTTYEIGTLELHVNSTVGGAKGNNSELYLQRTDGVALPILSWDVAFSTTDGFKINGEVSTVEMKSTDDGIYFKFSAMKAGDVITISGEYVCEAEATKYVIEESQFTWTGSAWNKYIEVDYTTYEIGELQFVQMEPGRLNMAYFNRVDGEQLPIKSTENNVNWNTAFNFLAGSGVGITLNGESIYPTLKFPDNLFLELDANPSAGDVLVIGGTFYSQDLAIKYVIENSSFEFNGTSWEVYVEGEGGTDTPEITYTEYTVSDLIVHLHSTAGNENANNTTLWLFGTGDTSNAWAYYTCESGTGVKKNGEDVAGIRIQDFSGGLYLKEFSANAGDVITIGGTFVNDERATKYVIAKDYYFQWNGSGWVAYVPPVVYDEYTLSNLQVANTSMAGGAYCANNVLSLTMDGGATVSDWPWFVYESGVGFTVNGESAALTGGIANAVQDTSGGLYFQFAGVNVGDIVSIGGVFSNADLAIRYVIPETKFTWTGTAWEAYVPPVVYEEYTVSNLQVADTSMAGGAYCANNVLSLTMLGGATVKDWPWFVYESGEGFKVNGESAALTGGIANAVQDTSGGLYFQFAGVNVGDIVSIGGVFSNADLAIRYVIPETRFTWTGTEWEAIDETVYTEYELGVIEPNTNSSTFGAESARCDHLYTQGAIALPVQDWETAFKLESGYGVKVNGEELSSFEMKSTDGGLWFGLSNIKAGDEVSICGTFKNTKHATIYVIEESKMVWNGYTWEKYVEYTTYELGEMKILSNSSTSAAVYVTTVNGEVLPINSWEYRFIFLGDSGIGITLNGEQVVTNDIKSPDGNLYIGLADKVVEEGAVLKIGGTFRNLDTATAYVITESEFVFVNSVWKSRLDIAKESACAELEEYKTNFVQDDYYDAEWNSFDTIIEEGKASINAAMTSEEIASIVVSVKEKMDDVVTKEESDAIFNELKQSAKDDVANYKSESDYRADDWATIQTIIVDASAQIDASASVTEINNVVESAKAEMNAVKTSAQRDAEDAAVASAKADLVAYKSESDYRANDWATILTIIADASAQIDEVIGNETAIGEIVVSAKAEMDAVKTSAQRDADDAAVANAKADLASYKSAVDYRDAQWAEIQAIITKANGDIDLAVGDQTAIDAIVTNAKKDVDKVKTSKTVAKDEVREYYGAIDHSLYSEEAEEIISGYMAEVMTAIDNATTNEQIDTAIAEFKGKVEKVETLKPAGDSEEKGSLGCVGSMGAFGLTSILGLVGVVSLIRRKKEER